MNKNTDSLKEASNESCEPSNELEDLTKPTMWQVIFSVMSAFVGIQNSKNKERDFKHGNFKVFVFVAAALTLLFLATIFTVVQLVTG